MYLVHALTCLLIVSSMLNNRMLELTNIHLSEQIHDKNRKCSLPARFIAATS